jgi:hypothetical protein
VNERRGAGDGVWLLLFLALVLAAKPAADAASHPPTSTTRPKARQYARPAAPLAPSPAARSGIPANYLALYQSAAKSCPGLPWGVLAGIGKVETDHGRSRAPGVRSGVNSFGCCAGPMQFNIRNGPPSTWDTYGRGGNVYDPCDAIPAATRLLCANGARGGRDLRSAIYAYNHAGWYVDQVLTLARSYQQGRR